MNKEQLQGNWEQLKGKFQSQWGKLTDDELQEAKGDRTALVGLIREKYGIAKEEAEKEVDRFMKEAA